MIENARLGLEWNPRHGASGGVIEGDRADGFVGWNVRGGDGIAVNHCSASPMVIVWNQPHTRLGDDDVAHAHFGDVAGVRGINHGLIILARQQGNAERRLIGDGCLAVVSERGRETAGERQQAVGIRSHQLCIQNGGSWVLDDDGNADGLAGRNDAARI